MTGTEREVELCDNADEPEDGWDALVVGSGIGGLVCAAYLSVAGLRVLVLEHHDIAGGNAHVFRRRREYEFDVGVHYLGDCGPDGLLPAILGGLGLAGRVEFAPMDQGGFDLIQIPGVTLAVPADWDRYRQRLRDVLPDDAAGIDTFIEICQGIAAERRGLLLDADAANATSLLDRIPLTVQWGRRSLATLFDYCELSTKARTALAAQSGDYGMAPPVASVAMHAAVIDHYLRGAHYPVGGGQELVAALVEVLEAHGGELWTRSRVERILIEGKRTVGVLLADGRTVRAPRVVSNADYRRTMLELVGTEHVGAATAKRARGATMALPFTVLYIALDEEFKDRPNANLWWYRDDDIDDCYARITAGDLDEVPFVFISFASLKDPDSDSVRPPGHANFQVMTLTPPTGRWWGVDEDGPACGTTGKPYRRLDVYRDRKKRLTDAMLDAAEQALGRFRDRIVHLECATPLTQERFTRSTGGTPYGVAQWGRSGGRPDTRTEIEGLYLVGASTQFGNGVAGVAIGGIVCAGQILDRPLMPQVHAGAVLADPSLLPDRPEDWDPFVVSRGLARRRAKGPRRERSATSSRSL